MANLVEKTLGKALGAIFKNFSPDKLEMVTPFEAVLSDCAGNALSCRTSCAASAC